VLRSQSRSRSSKEPHHFVGAVTRYGFGSGSGSDGSGSNNVIKHGKELGLKRKCMFSFSRKCENHAKMGRISRNFTKFRFVKNFLENKKRRFSRKFLIFFARIFAKTKNADFRENIVYFSQKILQKRKTPIFAKIFAKISPIFN
jgi:hypothetical protein